MESSVILNIVAIVLSVTSLTISAVLVGRQTELMRQSNMLPVMVDLRREFSSPEFQTAQEYVLGRLPLEHPPERGTYGLPEPAKLVVINVSNFYTTLATLVTFGMVDEVAVVSIYGYQVNRLWNVLEPYIQAERKIRNSAAYLAFLEDLVCRVRAHWPPTEAYGLRLRSLARGKYHDLPAATPSPDGPADTEQS